MGTGTPSSASTATARGMKMALVVSRFNEPVTTALLQGAEACLERHGARRTDWSVFFCPGAFELPQVADRLAASDTWDAIICLGAVIRGETPHFEHVCRGTVTGIQQVAVKHGIPVLFGVLTTDTEQQARARAGGNRGNKGWDAAMAAIEMVTLYRSLPRKRRRQGK